LHDSFTKQTRREIRRWSIACQTIIKEIKKYLIGPATHCANETTPNSSYVENRAQICLSLLAFPFETMRPLFNMSQADKILANGIYLQIIDNRVQKMIHLW
jgi:hypothetical protein